MEEIFFGAALGLASGLHPGPLLTLVVTATLQRGFAAGARVAAAPLATDAPVIALCVVVLRQLPLAWQAVLGLLGGAVVVVLGIRTGLEARTAELPAADAGGTSRDFWRGVAVNLLNPNAWLFWTAVGGPLLVRTADQRPWAAIGFLGAFFTLLIGSKLAVAALLARLSSLQLEGLANERACPGAVEHLRETGLVRLLALDLRPGRSITAIRVGLLRAQSHVANDSQQVGAELAAQSLQRAVQGSVGAKALHEDLLSRVLDVLRWKP